MEAELFCLESASRNDSIQGALHLATRQYQNLFSSFDFPFISRLLRLKKSYWLQEVFFCDRAMYMCIVSLKWKNGFYSVLNMPVQRIPTVKQLWKCAWFCFILVKHTYIHIYSSKCITLAEIRSEMSHGRKQMNICQAVHRLVRDWPVINSLLGSNQIHRGLLPHWTRNYIIWGAPYI